MNKLVSGLKSTVMLGACLLFACAPAQQQAAQKALGISKSPVVAPVVVPVTAPAAYPVPQVGEAGYCAKLLMAQAYGTPPASGVYSCLAPNERASFFSRYGWNGDPDVVAYFNKARKDGSSYTVISYVGNPVVDNVDPTLSHWLFWVKELGSGYDFTLDASGKVVAIA